MEPILATVTSVVVFTLILMTAAPGPRRGGEDASRASHGLDLRHQVEDNGDDDPV